MNKIECRWEGGSLHALLSHTADRIQGVSKIFNDISLQRGFIDYDQCEYPRAEDPGPSNGEIFS